MSIHVEEDREEHRPRSVGWLALLASPILAEPVADLSSVSHGSPANGTGDSTIQQKWSTATPLAGTMITESTNNRDHEDARDRTEDLRELNRVLGHYGGKVRPGVDHWAVQAIRIAIRGMEITRR
ncbi:hypothetical protein ON010_g18493 [Phytophthora cinnamomi]|nr:hypothetical protein ON010_g18493 [Phytophthora cinnamomi]